MKHILRKLTVTASAISIALLSSNLATSPTAAGVLENLERERASVIQNILDPELSPSERQKKIQGSKMGRITLLHL